jgi:hypothetical protein
LGNMAPPPSRDCIGKMGRASQLSTGRDACFIVRDANRQAFAYVYLAGAARGGAPPHPRRGPAHRRQHRQAAGAAAAEGRPPVEGPAPPQPWPLVLPRRSCRAVEVLQCRYREGRKLPLRSRAALCVLLTTSSPRSSRSFRRRNLEPFDRAAPAPVLADVQREKVPC